MNHPRVTYQILPNGNADVNPLTNIMLVCANVYYTKNTDEGDFIVCNGVEISLNRSLAIRAHVRYVNKVILCINNGIAVFVSLVNSTTLIPFTIENNIITPWQAIVYDAIISNIVYHNKLYVSTMTLGTYVHHTYTIGDHLLVRGDALRIPNTETMCYIDDEIIVLSSMYALCIYDSNHRQLARFGDYWPTASIFSHENHVLKFTQYNRQNDQYRRYNVRF